MSILTVERVGANAVITLNRPDKLNALNSALLDRLDAALDEVEAGDSRALVLTGAGRTLRPCGCPTGRACSSACRFCACSTAWRSISARSTSTS